MRNPFLIGERVYLRPIEEADAERCYPWISDPEVRLLIGQTAVPNTAKDSVEYIRGADGRRRQMFAMVTRQGDEHVGNCELMGIDLIHRRAEVGIVIGPPEHRGKGLGREAVRLLCDHAFGALNLHKVYLRVFESNERAIRSYRALGFREEGRLREHAFLGGRYVDVLFMGLLRAEWACPEPGRGASGPAAASSGQAGSAVR